MAGNQESDGHELAELIRLQEQQRTILLRLERNELQFQESVLEVETLVGKLTDHQAAIRRRAIVAEKSLSSGILDDVQEFLATHQMTMVETLEKLANSDRSIARFGDGELRAIFNPWFRFSFQTNSAPLAGDLREALTTLTDSLMVALPLAGRDVFWASLYPQVWAQLSPLLNTSYRYANAQISRPIAFEHLGEAAVELWREVWRDRKVGIITGSSSRFDVLPELFDSAASVERIDSVDSNAYQDIPRLLGLQALDDVDLFVLSLGPAGTVLAKMLDSAGYRALDVGHLSASYLRVFHNGAHPESMPVTGRR